MAAICFPLNGSEGCEMNIYERIAELEAIEGIEEKIDNLIFDPEAAELVDLRRQVADGIRFYSVAVHWFDRAFGGQEEGGWWFDYGEPDHDFFEHTRLFATMKEAEAYGPKLDDLIAELNEGRPEVSSVISKGRFCWVIQEGYPHSWPEKFPRYE